MTPLNIELDSEGMKHLQAHILRQENDIKVMADHFESQKYSWKSFEEMDAYYAQAALNAARKRIMKLQDEINEQLKIIQLAELDIRNFKKKAKAEAGVVRNVGKPVMPEAHETIVKKFMANWVVSLMEVLNIDNCRKLEECIDTTSDLNLERKWRRWLNGDAIPRYKSFEALLGLKVTKGKHFGQALVMLPTNPNSEDLLTLIRFA